jgi:hypothetical protein
MRRRTCWALGLLALACARLVSADAPPGRYTLETAGVVYDTRTKLYWQRELPASYQPVCAGTTSGAPGEGCSVTEAKQYCSQLSVGNSVGWRLPTRAELLSLLDRTRSDPAIDPAAFPRTPSTSFWSSTPFTGGALEGIPNGVVQVNFTDGASGYQNGNDAAKVRCVR